MERLIDDVISALQTLTGNERLALTLYEQNVDYVGECIRDECRAESIAEGILERERAKIDLSNYWHFNIPAFEIHKNGMLCVKIENDGRYAEIWSKDGKTWFNRPEDAIAATR